jgi:hypothetical protein
MKAMMNSENKYLAENSTLVTTHKATECHNAEDSYYFHCHGSLKSQICVHSLQDDELYFINI